jgi:hypothetical protein
MALETSDGFPLRGRRQHRATQSEHERTRLAIKFLVGLNTAEYVGPTVKRRAAKDGWLGMEAGIAEKPGNAGGVKASTAFNREWTNIYYTQR